MSNESTGTIGLILAIASMVYNVFNHYHIKRCDTCCFHSECMYKKGTPNTSTSNLQDLENPALKEDLQDLKNPARKEDYENYIVIGSNHDVTA